MRLASILTDRSRRRQGRPGVGAPGATSGPGVGSGGKPRGLPVQSRPVVDKPRLAAFDLLVAVRRDDAYANLAWPAILAQHALSGRDAAFATELAYGTLRWQGRHDAVLTACVDRPLDELDPDLLDCLRLGVHQLHNMRVGDHAAVSQSVDLVAATVNPGAGRLANAVLRRVATRGRADLWLAHLVETGAIPDPLADRDGYLAVAQSHPRWIVEALRDALAEVGEELPDLLAANNRAAGVTLAARSLDREALLRRLVEQGIAARAGSLAHSAIRVAAVNPANLPEIATGAAGVQDEGSQLVAQVLAEAPLFGPDTRWLDLCAGPGGKAALLAAAVAGRGGSLTAVELHPHRAELVTRALRPVPGRHDVVVGDARQIDLGKGYDRVLVDAPCTGLGAIRRRPESRWRRSLAELDGLVSLQRELLARALGLVRPGGLVLYATCSPLTAETTGVIEAMGDRACQLIPITGPQGTADGPFLRIWPHRHDTDGMFAALLRPTD